MERRVLLAVFLSFLVLFVYQLLVVREAPPPSRQQPTQAQPLPPQTPAPRSTGLKEPAPEDLPTVEPLVADTSERDVIVQTPHVRAVFSTRGAELTSWQLRDYLTAGGEPVELVATDLPEGFARPFSLRTPNAEMTARLGRALFKPSTASLDLSSEPGTVAFEYRDASGLVARKVFRFDPVSAPYVVEVDAQVESQGAPVNTIIEWGPGLGPDLVEEGGWAYRQGAQGIFFREGEVSRLGADDVAEQTVYEGEFGFVGVDDHYFITTVIQPQRSVRVEYRSASVPDPAGDDGSRSLMAYSVDVSGPPVSGRFFVGPKEFDVLATTGRDLVRAIDFGIFSVIVVPLLRSLKWVHGFVGNYGWSIIILTILINAAMFPLRHKSVTSMRKMQELQPEIKAIQDRYAKLKMTDPARQKMNTEVMSLYRDRGVNPASGCLPMLLTLPVLFAFYSLLSVAIEIRGAPFIWWIRDLSAHDPLYVTPLLMGGTMVWQQKLTPSTADPTQQKVMMFMPIVFTFMFLWAPSGLVLYWLVSNVWAIGQQIVTNRLIGPPRVRAARPAAERRQKRRPGGAEAAREA